MSESPALQQSGLPKLLRKTFARDHTTLGGRIFWSVIPIVFLLWATVGAISIYKHHDLLSQEFMKRAEAMAQNLAYSSELGVFAEDAQLLEASLRGVFRDPDFGYVMIYGDHGKLLAAKSKSGGPTLQSSGKMSEDQWQRLENATNPTGMERRDFAGDYIEILAPIVSEERRTSDELLIGSLTPAPEVKTIGAVRLGLSLESLEQHTESLVRLWLSISVVLLGVSAISIYMLSARITDPVKRLTSQAKNIAAGVLDDVITVESRDEIGQLAASFNHMAQSLKKNIDEKEAAFEKVHELNRTLEKRIEERTAELQDRTAELETRSADLQRSLTEVRAMGEISRAVSSSLDLQQVLNTIARYAVTLSDSSGCAIFEFNAKRQALDVVASHNLTKPFIKRLETTALDPETAMITKPFQIPDMQSAKEFRFRDVSIKEGYHAALVVPMGVETAARGAVLFRRDGGAFSYRIVDLLATLANQSKVAIDNARLFENIQQREVELEQASMHKSQFLANMSHELRTPLNAILGYTELIQDDLYGDVPKQMHEILERIEYNGRHLLGLINTVLDLSKIEAGKLSFTLSEYSMNEVVHLVTASVEGLANEKGLELKLEAPAELPVAYGDEQRLVQVLINLVGNAIKFTDEGSVTLHVETMQDDFLLSIRDTGPGVPLDQQNKIFEEFHQVDNSSTREKGGSGLGLSITKRIVEMHGGTLWLESAPGQGAKFNIRLPIRVEASQHGETNTGR